MCSNGHAHRIDCSMELSLGQCAIPNLIESNKRFTRIALLHNVVSNCQFDLQHIKETRAY